MRRWGRTPSLERLRLLPDIGSRRSRRSARDPMIQRVSSSCTHVISRISKTVGRFPKRLGGSPRNAGTDRTVQMWHVWHDLGKKGSRARALGRRYLWRALCCRLGGARTGGALRKVPRGGARIKGGRAGATHVVARGPPRLQPHSSPREPSNSLKTPQTTSIADATQTLLRSQAESGKRQPVSGRNEAKSVWT